MDRPGASVPYRWWCLPENTLWTTSKKMYDRFWCISSWRARFRILWELQSNQLELAEFSFSCCIINSYLSTRSSNISITKQIVLFLCCVKQAQVPLAASMSLSNFLRQNCNTANFTFQCLSECLRFNSLP